jgi:hypothetical protein
MTKLVRIYKIEFCDTKIAEKRSGNGPFFLLSSTNRAK